MATAAQRRWAASHRAAAAKDPARYAPIRIKSSVDRKAEAKAEPAWRAAAREGAAVKSYMRAGMTKSEAKAAAGIKAAKAKEPIGIGVMPVKKFKPGDLKPPALDPLSGKPLVAAVHAKPTPPGMHVRPPTDIRVERETFWEALKGKSGEIRKYEIDPLEKKVRKEQLGLISQASRISRYNAQLNIYENRLNKYPISDGVFTGSEKEYERYKKDYGKYIGKFKQVNTETDAYDKQVGVTESKRTKLAGLELKSQRARFGGLAGKYEEAERTAAEKLPSLKDVEKMGTKFKETHPETAKKIYKSFQAAHEVTQMELKGTVPYSGTLYKPILEGEITPQEVSTKVFMRDIDRARLAGVLFEPKKFVKAVVTTAAWVAVPPAIKGVAILGKAIGAGARVKRAAQLAGVGMGAMYTHQVGTEIRSAERIAIKAEEDRLRRPLTRYERETVGGYAQGAVFGDVIFTEVLPMFAGGYIGTKAITVAPKVTKIVIRKAGFISKKFKAGTKAMLTDNKAMMNAGKSEKQRLAELVKSEEKRLGRSLLESEYNALKALVKKPKTMNTAKDIFKKIDEANARKVASGEYKEVKIGTGAQQQIQLVKVEPKVLTKQKIKEVSKLKEQFELKIDQKQKLKIEQEAKQRALVKEKEAKLKAKQKTESALREEQRLKLLGEQKQTAYQKEMRALAEQMPSFKRKTVTKTLQKQVVKSKTLGKQMLELKQKYKQKLITKQEYKQKLAQLNKQKVKLAQQQKQTLMQAKKTISITGLVLTLKVISDVATLIKSAQEMKPKPMEKVTPKEKLRMALLEIPALTYKQAISSISAIASVAKAITEAKPAKKYIPPRVPKKPKVKKVKIIPPIIPTIKIPKKKKRIIKKKPKVIVGYTPYEIRSRIATLHEMFG